MPHVFEPFPVMLFLSSPLLTIIFNKSLEQGEVPTDWRKANVTAIYKKGNKYEPSNYRPVSLTSLCCKLQEHILISNVLSHLEEHAILTDCQHGFRDRDHVILFIWIPHCGAIFEVGAHHRHVSHCFCFLFADSEITSQEAEHAVGLFHDPIDMRFPIKVIW